MTYFRVKPQYDNTPRYVVNRRGQRTRDGIFIGNELLTACERSKINCADAIIALLLLPVLVVIRTAKRYK